MVVDVSLTCCVEACRALMGVWRETNHSVVSMGGNGVLCVRAGCLEPDLGACQCNGLG